MVFKEGNKNIRPPLLPASSPLVTWILKHQLIGHHENHVVTTCVLTSMCKALLRDDSDYFVNRNIFIIYFVL